MLAAYWNFDCPARSLFIDNKRYHGYAVVRYQRVFYLCLDYGYRDHLETDEKNGLSNYGYYGNGVPWHFPDGQPDIISF